MNKLTGQALLFLGLLVTACSSAAQSLSYYEQQLQSTAITAFFYAASIVLLIVFGLFNVASKNNFGLWYTLQFAIGLFFVACVDRTAEYLLWPNNPEFTDWVPLTALLTLNGNGLLLAVYSSSEESPPLMKKLSGTFHVMGLISFVCILLIPVAPIIVLALVANILFLPMVLSQVLSVMSWRPAGAESSQREYLYAGRFSRVTGLLFVLSVLIIGAIAWFQLSKDTFFYADFSYTFVRLTYALLSLSLVATYLAHIVGIREDREEALQRELQTARRAVQASEEKLLAERDFARMRELASSRRQKLFEASHDIRQPLVSLRLTLDKLKHSAELKHDIDYQQALDYIDDLADSFKPDDAEQEFDTEPAPRSERQKEVMPLNLLLQTIQQMFSGEASSKDIELRTVSTEMSALVNPVAVMRIVSNTVSNAIQHSGSNKILVGCRRAGDKVRIEIHDKGEGLTQHQFEQLSRRGQKGAASQGEGLGLANCVELALENDFQFGVAHSKLAGNYFLLIAPRA